MKAVCSFLAMAMLLSCGDPLKHPERIEELRVLAARTEVVAEPDDARPAPGQAASVRFLTAAPRAVQLTWALYACVAAPATSGIPVCASPPFAESITAFATSEEPHLEFVMPSEVELLGRERVIILGAICDDAGPAGGGVHGAEDCPGQGTRVSFDVFIEREDGNRNPNLAAAEARIDGAVWPVTDRAAACSALPSVRAASGKHQLGLELSESNREALATRGTSESLLISQFSTAGDLARPYSFIDPLEPPAILVDWEPPKSAPFEGQVSRFFFVVRDHRGGADWTERALCVLP